MIAYAYTEIAQHEVEAISIIEYIRTTDPRKLIEFAREKVKDLMENLGWMADLSSFWTVQRVASPYLLVMG